MRQFTVGILCGAAFLANAACNKSPEGQGPEAVNAGGEEAGGPYYTVQADDIADPKITALQGTFQMLNATAATGIPSSGWGGACLVFTAKDLGFTTMDKRKCTTNASCSKLPTSSTEDQLKYSPDPAHPEHFENRYGYCDTKNNQCWSKPIEGNNAVCNRPIQMIAGTVDPVPKDKPVDVSKWVKLGAKARVVACLNKGSPPWPGGKAPCGELVSANRIEVWSETATLHK